MSYGQTLPLNKQDLTFQFVLLFVKIVHEEKTQNISGFFFIRVWFVLKFCCFVSSFVSKKWFENCRGYHKSENWSKEFCNQNTSLFLTPLSINFELYFREQKFCPFSFLVFWQFIFRIKCCWWIECILFQYQL